MKSYAEYIRSQGYDDSTDLVTTVAATFVFHRDWQKGHAGELAAEREAAAKEREEKKAAKAQEREAKKAEREQKKAEKEAEREAKRQEREAKKAEKEAAKEGADGDDSGEEAPRSRRGLRTKGEPVAAGASADSF
jgi:hypothetical protein